MWRRKIGSLAAQSHSTRGSRCNYFKGSISGKERRRDLGNQGAPDKCPLLYELLWDWFIDYRASVKGRLSPKFVLKKAKQLATRILDNQRKAGTVSFALPKVDKYFFASLEASISCRVSKTKLALQMFAGCAQN